MRPTGIPRAVAFTLLLATASPALAQHSDAYAVVGLFFGAIEEGARIFTPARLLPFDHPEALHHEFPTVLQLHGTEFQMLVWLGVQAGMRLWPTLERYPTQPAEDWPYTGFRQPPDTMTLHSARIIHRARTESPIPGLRAVLFDGSSIVAFLVDTRGLTLAERGMSRATSMGLDLSRAQFVSRLQQAAPSGNAAGYTVVLY